MPVWLFTDRVGLNALIITKSHVHETALVGIHGTQAYFPVLTISA